MASNLVLVVDDELRYLRLLRFNLESSGYRVIAAATGKEAVQAAASLNPDLVLLDLRLPDLDGFEVCRRIREFSPVPIIMVTARGEVLDKVRGLKLGADDYIAKPFSAEELLARVETVMRRSQGSPSPLPARLIVGEVVLDFVNRKVTRGGQEIELSPTEYRLLHCLASNAGRTMTPKEIQERVWGQEYREHYEGLRTYIHRLRQKLEPDPENPIYLVSRHGVGYMLSATGGAEVGETGNSGQAGTAGATEATER